jgi:hypothetical protein
MTTNTTLNTARSALTAATKAVAFARANSAAYDSTAHGRYASGCELSAAFSAYEAALSAYEAAANA